MQFKTLALAVTHESTPPQTNPDLQALLERVDSTSVQKDLIILVQGAPKEFREELAKKVKNKIEAEILRTLDAGIPAPTTTVAELQQPSAPTISVQDIIDNHRDTDLKDFILEFNRQFYHVGLSILEQELLLAALSQKLEKAFTPVNYCMTTSTLHHYIPPNSELGIRVKNMISAWNARKDTLVAEVDAFLTSNIDFSTFCTTLTERYPSPYITLTETQKAALLKALSRKSYAAELTKKDFELIEKVRKQHLCVINDPQLRHDLDSSLARWKILEDRLDKIEDLFKPNDLSLEDFCNEINLVCGGLRLTEAQQDRLRAAVDEKLTIKKPAPESDVDLATQILVTHTPDVLRRDSVSLA
jgi:hypothetical protein